MRTKRFLAFIFWKDGHVEDADEMVVFAADAADARLEARRTWRLTKGAEWPRCVILKVTVSPIPREAARPSL